MRRKPRCAFCGSKRAELVLGDRWCKRCGVAWGRKGLSTFVGLPDLFRQVLRGTLLVVEGASREEPW